jgi:DNA-binding Xre family transcriptional regulator
LRNWLALAQQRLNASLMKEEAFDRIQLKKLSALCAMLIIRVVFLKNIKA